MATVDKKRKDKNGKEKKQKKKLKQLYNPNDVKNDIQPAQHVLAPPQVAEADSDDEPAEGTFQLALEPAQIFTGDRRPYDPGEGFVLSRDQACLSCEGLDPATHELWLIQLPADWSAGQSVKLSVRQRKNGVLAGSCRDAAGSSYTVVQEHQSLASALYVIPPTLKEGVPAQITRRVTLMRSDEVIREADDVSMTAQLPSSSSHPAVKKPKLATTTTAAAGHAGQKQPSAAELSLDDILVIQESPVKQTEQQKEKKKEKKKKKRKRKRDKGGAAVNGSK